MGSSGCWPSLSTPRGSPGPSPAAPAAGSWRCRPPLPEPRQRRCWRGEPTDQAGMPGSLRGRVWRESPRGRPPTAPRADSSGSLLLPLGVCDCRQRGAAALREDMKGCARPLPARLVPCRLLDAISDPAATPGWQPPQRARLVGHQRGATTGSGLGSLQRLRRAPDRCRLERRRLASTTAKTGCLPPQPEPRPSGRGSLPRSVSLRAGRGDWPRPLARAHRQLRPNAARTLPEQPGSTPPSAVFKAPRPVLAQPNRGPPSQRCPTPPYLRRGDAAEGKPTAPPRRGIRQRDGRRRRACRWCVPIPAEWTAVPRLGLLAR